MIKTLQKISSPIIGIQEIPVSFFNEIEESPDFGDHLFPAWFNNVFGKVLKDKFELVYDEYKKIISPFERQKVIEAFTHGNRIQELCENNAAISCIEINNLPEGIRLPLKNAFTHLYNSLDNLKYQTHANENLLDVLDKFADINDIEICPFCGIEGYINVEGEPRQTLDHWLYKESYPFAAANFDNLMPIGDKCNRRPAKGTKNVLFNETRTNRVVAFYPYKSHQSIDISFRFINEPTSTNISDDDWELTVTPKNTMEQGIFDSWNTTFNIETRYNDFVRRRIIPKWEKDYIGFIEEDHKVNHATNILEFKENLAIWKGSFKKKSDPRAILFRAFANFLINNATDGYLTGLYQNFSRI
ncbi:hypothetical protein ACSTS3_18615 [Aquimarina muelleri]|uniref:hypothetical protein n=1 Tax=Aquimarina muelleri TaxID=279356 RepID=UPI003F683168